jgi:hypothetical protein
MDSSASVKTIRDAEREVAELRLAMMGMGKAMSEWLDQLPKGQTEGEETAWRGLSRIKGTLLDAAGKDVDEIVKEWGWHEGLEAGSSRNASSVDLQEDMPKEPAFADPPIQLTPTSHSTPTLPTLEPARTPTISTFRQQQATFPADLPSPVRTAPISAPRSFELPGPFTPNVAGPSTMRIPLNQRLASASGFKAREEFTAPLILPERASLPIREVMTATERTTQGGGRRENKEELEGGDPLAGLGVGLTVISPTSPEWHGRRPKSGVVERGAKTVDPLLGLGVR